jgi:KipI family sensor histidine kinase inhibitor
VIEIRPFGDAALQVVLGAVTDADTLARIHAAAIRVSEARRLGEAWGAPVPGLTTLLVPFDPHVWSTSEAAPRLADLLGDPLDSAAGTLSEGVLHRIPVRYGGDDGPDLLAVASRLGLEPREVIELHASVCYTVYIIGFMPGFGYLADLPEALRLPRRDTPRTIVPAGSVAIAGRHTAVYPSGSPGGWHLLGRTEVRTWDIDRDPPALLRPGDQVRFEPLT